jgi:hypothetical protein
MFIVVVLLFYYIAVTWQRQGRCNHDETRLALLLFREALSRECIEAPFKFIVRANQGLHVAIVNLVDLCRVDVIG